MKNVVSKSLIAACVTGVAILSTAKASVAQVNMSFLTEVAESCQKDVLSSEYYQQMGYKTGEIPSKEYADGYLLGDCIESRYFYLQVISQFPWLVSTKEMLPGYPGAVAVSLLAEANTFSKTFILDCLVSKNSESQECTDADGFKALSSGLIDGGYVDMFYGNDYQTQNKRYSYMCPSCVVAYNKNPSGRKMIGAFIEWFTTLEPSQRKEVMSILGDEQAQINNRVSIQNEADKAWNEYTAIRQRMTEEEKERRRRELLGE